MIKYMTRLSQKFGNILVVYANLKYVYHMTKAVQIVGNIVVNGMVTHCALLHSVCDLKGAQMNIQSNLGTYALWVWTEAMTRQK